MSDKLNNPIQPAAIVQDLEQALASIQPERDFLDELAKDTAACIARWKDFAARRSGVPKTPDVSPASHSANANGDGKEHESPQIPAIVLPTAPSGRLLKGEGLKIINELFVKLGPGRGLSAADISRQTGISWSSVRNILNRDGCGYVQRNDTLWYKE